MVRRGLTDTVWALAWSVENSKLKGQVRDAIPDFTIKDGPCFYRRGLNELWSKIYILKENRKRLKFDMESELLKMVEI